MSEAAELKKRVTKLESEVRRAREDSAAARILAGGADRDVSEMQAELRAHTGSLEALRETQVEQGKTLAKHGKRLDQLDHKFDRLDRKFDAGFAQADENFAKVGKQLGVLQTGQERITELLTEHLDKPRET